MQECTRCKSKKFVKDGKSAGKQRFICKDCGKTYGKDGKYSQEKKDFAIKLYLNNVGIRKIGLFLKVSHVLVLNWIRRAHKDLSYKLGEKKEQVSAPDVIELDEIFTYVKKNMSGQSYGLLTAEGKSVLLRLTSDKE